MYGQNLGCRPDAPGEPIFTKFCVWVCVPDVFLNFEFQKDRMKNVGAVGVEFSPLPLKRHIAYTTACCYRTSRDKYAAPALQRLHALQQHIRTAYISFVHNICPLREMGRFSNDHFTKSATILASSSRNGQTQCPFHELGNTLAYFVKWT